MAALTVYFPSSYHIQSYGRDEATIPMFPEARTFCELQQILPRGLLPFAIQGGERGLETATSTYHAFHTFVGVQETMMGCRRGVGTTCKQYPGQSRRAGSNSHSMSCESSRLAGKQQTSFHISELNVSRADGGHEFDGSSMDCRKHGWMVRVGRKAMDDHTGCIIQ